MIGLSTEIRIFIPGSIKVLEIYIHIYLTFSDRKMSKEVKKSKRNNEC